MQIKSVRITFSWLVFLLASSLAFAEPMTNSDQEFNQILKSLRKKKNVQRAESQNRATRERNIPRSDQVQPQAQKPRNVLVPTRRFAQVGGTQVSHSAMDSTQEDWKGEPDLNQFSVGGMVGLGIDGTDVGLALLGHASIVIEEKGFIPDINDQVWLEVQAGPFITDLSDGFMHSLRMRWDFHRNDEQGLYAIGGLGGMARGGTYRLFPYFGAGGFLKFNKQVRMRAEISHNLIAVGGSFLF